MNWPTNSFKTFLILVLLYPQFSDAGPVKYPVNPLITKQAVYISSNGITRFNKISLKATWHTLKGIQTYEPVLAGHLLLAGSNQGIFALNKNTGKIVWHLQTGSTLYSPTIAEHIAYIAGVNGILRAVTIKSGRILWTKKFAGWIYPPAIIGDILITGGQHAVVWGIDKNSGDIIWEKDLSGEELVYRPIVLPTTKVLLTTFGAKTIAISAQDGSTAWKFSTKTAASNPVVFKHQLFLNGFDGSMVSLDYRTGAAVWTQSLNTGLLFPATADKGILLTGDDEATVTLIDLQTGKILNQFNNHRQMIASPFIIDSSAILPVVGRQKQILLEIADFAR